MNFILRPLDLEDHPAWLRMRQALWADHSQTSLQLEMGEILRAPLRNGVIVAESASGELIGFVEVSQRDYGEGCATSPVGYVEGWYVDERFRGQGVGKALVEAAADWARAKGFSELGSDADLWNEESIAAHKALGFAETGRQVTFRKAL